MYVVIKKILQIAVHADVDEGLKFMGSSKLQRADFCVLYLCSKLDAKKMKKFDLNMRDEHFIGKSSNT